jgi:hypothetical protein
MTDKHEDLSERTDPVLVRPYISTGSPGPREAGPAQIWPESASLPVEPAGPRVRGTIVPVLAPPVARRRWTTTVRLLVPFGVVFLALAVGGYMLLVPDGPPRAAGPLTALPAPVGPTPSDPAASTSPAAAQSVAPPPRIRRTTRVPGTASASASASASAPRETTSGTPPPTLSPPPAADRTGPIVSEGGRCLALGGLFAIDGSPVHVAGCTGGAAQEFTVATDGTLRVSGRCAQVTGDRTVRSVGCDDRPNAQWRSGPKGALVNPDSGRCLVDPGRPVTVTRAQACTGGGDQRWKLP